MATTTSKPEPTIAVQARLPTAEYNAMALVAGRRGHTTFIREAIAEKVKREKSTRKA